MGGIAPFASQQGIRLGTSYLLLLPDARAADVSAWTHGGRARLAGGLRAIAAGGFGEGAAVAACSYPITSSVQIGARARGRLLLVTHATHVRWGGEGVWASLRSPRSRVVAWARVSRTPDRGVLPGGTRGASGAMGVATGERDRTTAACEIACDAGHAVPRLEATLSVPLTTVFRVRVGVATDPEVLAWGIGVVHRPMSFELVHTSTPALGTTLHVTATWSRM
jgi:hypothetical protein